MNKLHFSESHGVLTDKCKFTENAMIGSLNCQQCKHCLAMSDTQNWVICELYNNLGNQLTQNKNEKPNQKY